MQCSATIDHGFRAFFNETRAAHQQNGNCSTRIYRIFRVRSIAKGYRRARVHDDDDDDADDDDASNNLLKYSFTPGNHLNLKSTDTAIF